MAGNLSHSECTCENPNLDVLAFRCVTFLRKLVWLQRRGHSVLGMEASHPHRTTTLFWPSSLWLLQKCSRGCYLITATAIWSPLLPFLLLRRSLGIFRNINLYFSEKTSMFAREILYKPGGYIMRRHLAVIKCGDCSQAHHFPLLTSSWFFDLSVYVF